MGKKSQENLPEDESVLFGFLSFSFRLETCRNPETTLNFLLEKVIEKKKTIKG